MANERTYVACRLDYDGCGSTNYILGAHRTKDGAVKELDDQYNEDIKTKDEDEYQKEEIDATELFALNAVSGFLAGDVDNYCHSYYYVVETTMED